MNGGSFASYLTRISASPISYLFTRLRGEAGIRNQAREKDCRIVVDPGRCCKGKISGVARSDASCIAKVEKPQKKSKMKKKTNKKREEREERGGEGGEG